METPITIRIKRKALPANYCKECGKEFVNLMEHWTLSHLTPMRDALVKMYDEANGGDEASQPNTYGLEWCDYDCETRRQSKKKPIIVNGRTIYSIFKESYGAAQFRWFHYDDILLMGSAKTGQCVVLGKVRNGVFAPAQIVSGLHQR